MPLLRLRFLPVECVYLLHQHTLCTLKEVPISCTNIKRGLTDWIDYIYRVLHFYLIDYIVGCVMVSHHLNSSSMLVDATR